MTEDDPIRKAKGSRGQTGRSRQEDDTTKERQDPTPVALYARVSSNTQDVDLQVAAQMRALRDYADKNGWMVAHEYDQLGLVGEVQ